MELAFDPTNPPPPSSPEPSQSSTPSPTPSEIKPTPGWGYVGSERNSFFEFKIRTSIIKNIKTGLAKMGLTALFAAAPKILPQICRSSLNYGGGTLLIIFGTFNNICGKHKDSKALSCVKRVAGVGELVLLAAIDIVTSLELAGDNETAQKIAEYLPPAFLTVFAFKMLFDCSLGIRSPRKEKLELALIEGLPTTTQVALITAGPIVKAINPELALLGGSGIAGAQSLYYFTKGISLWCYYRKQKSKFSDEEAVELNLPRNIEEGDDNASESSEGSSNEKFIDLRSSVRYN